MIKGIIFDADGTILNSMKIWEELGKRYLLERGIKAEDGLSDILYDMSLEEGSSYIKEQYKISDSPEKISSDMLMLIRDFYQNEVCEKPGLTDFLKKMRERRVVMGIATSGSGELVAAALERLGIIDFFDVILTCDELGANKKEPYIYLEAAKRLGTNPNETAVVEDAVYGIKAAAGVGFVTVGVEDKSNEKYRRELNAEADFCIKDFYDDVGKKLFSSDGRCDK